MSVPEDEDFLALEGVFSLVDMLSEVLPVVGDLGPQVVDKEWLSEVIFVIRVRHCFEVESHSCTALNIANLVLARRRVAVRVEELREGLAVLGEERVVTSRLPLLIEVDHVVGLRGEESAQLFAAKDVIKHMDLVDGRLSALVSNPGCSDERSDDEVDLPERCMREHQEGEASVGDQTACPHVVASVHARANLVKVVTCAHTPFPVISVDHVSHVVGLSMISLRFRLVSENREGRV